MDDLSLRQGQNEAMNFSINVSHSPSQNITEKNKLLSFFSQYSSRILNLNLSNGGERNSLKLGFKISAHNGDQLLLCWKLNTEIKRGKNVVFMAGITSRQSMDTGQYSTHGLGRLTFISRLPRSQDIKYLAEVKRSDWESEGGRRVSGVVRN